MPGPLVLASKGLGALLDVLPAEPAELRTLFVATAGDVYGEAPWIDEDRSWFDRHGFAAEDLDLNGSIEPVALAHKLFGADFVYIAGGNTYHLLDRVNRSGFREAITAHPDIVYAGASAGAVIACPDVGFIGNLDQRDLAPELDSTRGLGLVDLMLMPHANTPQVQQVMANWESQTKPVEIADDQAIVVENGHWRRVESH